jgi:hypothetical protein
VDERVVGVGETHVDESDDDGGGGNNDDDVEAAAEETDEQSRSIVRLLVLVRTGKTPLKGRDDRGTKEILDDTPSRKFKNNKKK